MGVADDLDLNMVRLEYEFFQVAVSIAKTGDGLLAGLVIHFDEFFFFEARAHPAATTTSSGFDHDGKANIFG